MAMKRLMTVGAVVFCGLLAGIGTASAHVVATPNTATQGATVEIAFQVPNEEASADTTKLEVTFPAAHPIASVVAKSLPGWHVQVDKVKLAKPLMSPDGTVDEVVSKITWTGGEIAPNSFQDFTVLAGPLPTNTDRLVFKAIQTYSNGDVVRWIDVPTPGVAAPEHPAPTVTLLSDDPLLRSASTALASPDEPSGSPTDYPVGVIGVLVGLVACVLAAIALRRTRSAR
ncbi:MAG TPA: YcnI family protein [Pseudonocardiaceae bacterium]|nr:YcnI family protein [Pseudonocardiaceae bacterium]